MAMAEGSRARYTLVCVEIDLSKPLVGCYALDNRTFNVEYESLEEICFLCGFHGHREGA
ncbi:hypothetical protein LINPERPRIM_LOCUS27403 [Linum perenne]